MCRIAGIINSSGDYETTILKMTNAMSHGGPDDNGVHVNKEMNVGL